ncbi:MAG: helix-turn-helix transcriptional regulator [Clostridiaceae bacterium]
MLKIDHDKFLLALAKAKLTTTKLKTKSGVGRNTISKIMNGGANVRPDSIGKIAEALNVSVEELISSDFQD